MVFNGSFPIAKKLPARRYGIKVITCPCLGKFIVYKNIMEYTTNQKGLITEMSVMLNVDSKYDCIVDVNGKLLKIQIKTAHLHPTTKDAIAIKCRSITTTQNHIKTGKYTSKDIDYFATVWENELYLIPVEECSASKTLHLIKENGRSNYSYLEDYKAQEVLNTL